MRQALETSEHMQQFLTDIYGKDEQKGEPGSIVHFNSIRYGLKINNFLRRDYRSMLPITTNFCIFTIFSEYLRKFSYSQLQPTQRNIQALNNPFIKKHIQQLSSIYRAQKYV